MILDPDYVAVIDKLLAKSEERKVPWEIKPSYMSTYECSIDAYTFEIGGSDDSFIFQMTDSEGNQLFSARAQEQVVYSDWREKELHDKLSRLFQSARRISLDVDKKLSNVNDLLDKL